MSDVKTYELSKVQETLWNQYEQGIPSIGIVFRCPQRIGKEEIQAIWNQLAEVHQILVTELEIPEQSTRPYQKVSDSVKVDIIESDENIHDDFKKVTQKQNGLGNWFVLFQNEDDSSQILIGANLLLTDKWSLLELASNFISALQGTELEEVLPYVQFSEWHKSALEDEDIEAKRFWEERVFQGEKKHVEDGISTNTYKSSIAIDSNNNQSNEAVCYSVAANVLVKHRGDDKLQVYYKNDGRYFEELNPIIGPFSLLCPLEIKSQKVGRLIPALEEELEEQKSILASYVPEIDGSTSQIVFEYWKADEKNFTEWNYLTSTQSEDLNIEFVEEKGKIAINIGYRIEKYTSEYIASLAEQIGINLKSYLEKKTVDNAELLSKIHEVASGKTTAINPNFIFERLAAADDTVSAIHFEDKTINYGELKNAIDNSAIEYQNQGVTSSSKVGLYLPGNLQYIVSLLSLWKLGATAIPVSKTAPLGRLESCLKLANADYVISDADIELAESSSKVIFANSELNTNEPEKTIERTTYDENTPAYILFTSGSTGEPKGCQISHYNLSNYLSWASEYYLNNESDFAHFPFFTSVGFDFTFTSILLPIVNGGSISIQDDQKSFDEHLLSIAQNADLGFVKLTPSHIRVLQSMDVDRFLPNNVILGGEALTHSQIEFLESVNSSINIYNEYGPTEATIGCVVAQVNSKDAIVPIGNPIDNTSIYLIDKESELLPEYCIGQLVIAGSSLSMGYINSELNTSFKESNESIASKHYYTGDIGYRDANGQLFYHGREDDQVKIRGNRIELAEISTAAESFEFVEQAVVTVDATSESIILYVTVSKSDIVNDLEAWLKQRLMPYALPGNIFEVSHIPLNENGKADLKELKKMAEAEEENVDVEALTDLPAFKTVSKLWKEILKIEAIKPTDHFIKLGGDSIKAIQLVNKLRQEGYEVNIREVLENPILFKLSMFLTNKTSAENSQEFAKDQGEIPLNPNQSNFLSYGEKERNGYNQSVKVKLSEKVNTESFYKAVDFLLQKHPILNAKFVEVDGMFQQVISESIEESAVAKVMTSEEFLAERKQQPIYELIDIEKGPLILCYLVNSDDSSQLYIYAHHLIIDTVSWRILVEDLFKAIQSYTENSETDLNTNSHAFFGARTEVLTQQSEKEATYWEEIVQQLSQQDFWVSGPFPYKNFNQKEFFMNEEVSNLLKGEANNRFETKPIELLLTAIGRAYKELNKTDFSCIMENNGRQSIQGAPDIEGSVGWFTSMYPLTVSLSEENEVEKDIYATLETYRAIPNNGIYFSYLHGHSLLPKIQMNYMGIYEADDQQGYQMEQDEFAAQNIHPEMDMRIGLGLSIVFGEKGLHVVLSYDAVKITEAWILEFSELLQSQLSEVSKFCTQELELIDKVDFKGLDEEDLEDILGDL